MVAGRSWTDEEEQLLVQLHRENPTLNSQQFGARYVHRFPGRNLGAVRRRFLDIIIYKPMRVSNTDNEHHASSPAATESSPSVTPAKRTLDASTTQRPSWPPRRIDSGGSPSPSRAVLQEQRNGVGRANSTPKTGTNALRRYSTLSSSSPGDTSDLGAGDIEFDGGVQPLGYRQVSQHPPRHPPKRIANKACECRLKTTLVEPKKSPSTSKYHDQDTQTVESTPPPPILTRSIPTQTNIVTLQLPLDNSEDRTAGTDSRSHRVSKRQAKSQAIYERTQTTSASFGEDSNSTEPGTDIDDGISGEIEGSDDDAPNTGSESKPMAAIGKSVSNLCDQKLDKRLADQEALLDERLEDMQSRATRARKKMSRKIRDQGDIITALIKRIKRLERRQENL